MMLQAQATAKAFAFTELKTTLFSKDASLTTQYFSYPIHCQQE